ncbi:MAG: GH3 auxin-responsive promoter family protein [Salibacteraceae bacterium]
MGLKSIAAKWLASWEVLQIKKWSEKPFVAQKKTFSYLIDQLQHTAFGKDHSIKPGMSYKEWKARVAIRDYEAFKAYVDRIRDGEVNVLWKGKPKYFCKTSGTTSGAKFIPMSEEGIKAQVKAARSALLCYIHQSGNSSFTDGKMIFLQGNPALTHQKGIAIGRLSGIVAHHVPSYLQRNRMPSWETNAIDDWEKKVDAIVDETYQSDMRLVSGIPPWVKMYFERLLAKTGKQSVKEVFPNLSVFAHGGVNYEPYKATMEKLIGGRIDSIETYPASEGFIAFQDTQTQQGLLLNLDAGIFYEFIPLQHVHDDNPVRLSLEEVELDENYAIVLNTSSGLWGYLIGDTVKFVSRHPFRIIVTGRVKHFISAFGEHVIAEEVEKAMSKTMKKLGFDVLEFHVAPQVEPAEGLPFHEWFIEHDQPELPVQLEEELDAMMRSLNSYYDDLINGKVLRPLKVRALKPGTFNDFMRAAGKLGGQNKLPRLSNDRNIADLL